MTPQDEFRSWYLTATGATLEKARRQGVADLKMLRAAFMAGREAGMTDNNKRLPSRVKQFWSQDIMEEKRKREAEWTGNR